MRQLLSALAYMHSTLQAVHCDVKPANILFIRLGKSPVIKLADFGLAKQLTDPNLNDRWGTPSYLAPEVMAGWPSTPARDVWAAGITMMELITGRQFAFPKKMRVSTCIMQNFRHDALLCGLLTQMLEPNPHYRINAAEALLHPFFHTLPTASAMVLWDQRHSRKKVTAPVTYPII